MFFSLNSQEKKKKNRDSNKQARMAYEKRHHWNELCIPTNNNKRIYECKIKQSRGINGIEVWIPRACVCFFSVCARWLNKYKYEFKMTSAIIWDHYKYITVHHIHGLYNYLAQN